MPRTDPVKVYDMVFLLVPVLAEQAAEVGRAHREHQRVRRQKLWRGNIQVFLIYDCQRQGHLRLS